MLRLFTDYQAVGPNGCFWILKHNNIDVNVQAKTLKLKKGDRVILDAHEDFEVTGVLDFIYVNYVEKEIWVAFPDWSTKKDKA